MVIGTLEFHCSHCWPLILGSLYLALGHIGCADIPALSFQPIAQLLVCTTVIPEGIKPSRAILLGEKG